MRSSHLVWLTAVALLGFFVGEARAQMSVEEAERIMHQKEAARQAQPAKPSTRPTIPTDNATSQPTAKQDDPREANREVIKLIHGLEEMVADSQSHEMTDIQKRQAWLAEVTAANEGLAKRRVTVTYKIKDVTFNPNDGFAVISADGATIKSDDPDVPDVVLHKFFGFVIVATEAQAGAITKESQMTLEGILQLGVSAEPAGEQPSYTFREGKPVPAHFDPVGWIDGSISPWREDPCFLMRENDILLIDGVKRTIAR